MKMKVIIAGSRAFQDYELLKSTCDKMLEHVQDVEIVSGTANGADKLGEKYAAENGFPVKQFPADWANLGKRAGFVRNSQMAEYADALIAFWDGKSKGTKMMIEIAQKEGLLIKVENF